MIVLVCDKCGEPEQDAALGATLTVPTLAISVHLCRPCLKPIGDKLKQAVDDKKPPAALEAASYEAIGDVLTLFSEAIVKQNEPPSAKPNA